MAFSLVPLAHAAQSAGHDVIFATASSTVDLLATAGVHVVDVAPEVDFVAMQPAAELAFRSNRPDAGPVTSSDPHFFQLYANAMTPGTKRLVRWWQPDLVIHPPEAVTARELDVPAVYHGIRFANHPDHVEPWKRRDSALVKGGAAAAWGTVAALDVTPPSMSLCGTFGVPMRYVPFDGGGVLPRWLDKQRSRPRIAVTLGTVAPSIVGDDPLRRLLAAAHGFEGEFIFALGGLNPASLGPLPDNVRAEKWVPLNAVLMGCDGVVHQGGAGVTMAALNAGQPQMVLPQGADQFDTAEAVSRRGVGFTGSTEESAAAQLERLLHDHTLRTAAAEVKAELATMPSPIEVLSQLVLAVSERRRLPVGSSHRSESEKGTER
jgi:UDP:flavonoid glycosyltransferase YjiC (YdhE family)